MNKAAIYSCLDIAVRVTQIVGPLLTASIAIWIGILSSRIQKQQASTQRQQAEIHHKQYRLALIERRMRVYNATLDFIRIVMRDSTIKDRDPLYALTVGTQEHHFLFGSEVGEYIDKLYRKGTKLHSINMAAARTNGVLRPEDIPEETQINEWFTSQWEGGVKEKFLKYLDFREP